VKEFKLIKQNNEKLDLDLVNPIVRNILENVVIPRSRNAYNLDFGVQAIHTSLANFAVMARLHYIPSAGNIKNTKMTTYYAMSFLSSGRGKDFVSDLIENELFADLSKGFDNLVNIKALSYNQTMRESMDNWIENGFNNKNEPYGKKEYAEDVKTKFMPTTVSDLGLRFGEATPEGLAYARSRVKYIDVGSPSLKIPEFSMALSSTNIGTLFTSLIELWENGNMSAKTTKNALLPMCNEVPILFNAYTDPSKILNDEKMQSMLVNNFSSGLGRRTFVVYPEEEDFIRKTTPPVKSIDKEIIDGITKPIMQNIKVFFNMNNIDTWKRPVQYFNDKASDYMNKVSDLCYEKDIELRGKITDGELANISSLVAKIEKLASLYAFIEGRVEINVDDCRYATYWSTYTSSYLGKISRVLTSPERLFNLMYRKNDWVSGIEIEQAGIFKNSFDFNKSLDNTLQNLSQYCSVKNTDLIVSNRDGGAILRVKKIPLVDPDKLVTSSMVGSHDSIKLMADGWTKSEFKFDNLYKFLCGEKECAITACELKDGKRLDDSATGRIQFIALDFDDGLTWEDGMKRFENYTYFAYQSRNHQKEKNGKICDRYRVILLLERELSLNKQQYANMYKKVLAILAPEADHSCTNIGRIFFSSVNSDFVYNDGKPFKAHLFLDENKTEKVYSARTKLDGSGLKDYFLSEIDVVNTQRTGGINLLARACYATRDPMKMSGKEEAKAWIIALSKLIFDAYWQKHNLEKEVLGILDKVWN